MKKVFAILLASLMLLGLCSFAFAVDDPSPVESGVYKVEYISYHTGKATNMGTFEVKKGETISFTAEKSDLTFENFTIQGKYELVSSSKSGVITDSKITIRPQEDLVVTANFKGAAPETNPTDGGNTSPATGVNPWFAVGMVALAIGAVGVILTTKRLVGNK